VDVQDRNPTVAPTLMKFQRGCHQVLSLMKEVTEEEEAARSSDSNGYHSDSDNTVMKSGNYQFAAKTARTNFLTRSVRVGSQSSSRVGKKDQSSLLSDSGFSSLPCSNTSPPSSSPSPPSSHNTDSDSEKSDQSRERIGGKQKKVPGWVAKVAQCSNCQEDGPAPLRLQAEVEKLSRELSSSRQTIVRLHEREEKMREKLLDISHQSSQIRISSASSVWVSSQPDHLVASYVQLYSEARLETMLSLDSMEGLSQAEELKNKLLFSVVVLSFRSVGQKVVTIRQKVLSLLQVSGTTIKLVSKCCFVISSNLLFAKLGQ